MTTQLYKDVYFDASHRLLHYQGKCQQLHGHRWRVEVWVEGTVDEKTKILVDYNTIKQIVERFDHMVILNDKDPMIMCLERFQPIIKTPGDPTSELLGEYFKNMLNNDEDFKRAEANVIKIRVWESPSSYAEIS